MGWLLIAMKDAGQIDYDFYKGKGLVGMPGFNQRVSDQSRAFGNIAKELGLRNVNSINDIARMYDYLGRQITEL